MSTGHTLKHYKENWYPGLMDRRNYSDWVERGQKTLGQRASEKVRQIIDTHHPEQLPDAVREKIRMITKKAEERVKSSARNQGL